MFSPLVCTLLTFGLTYALTAWIRASRWPLLLPPGPQPLPFIGNVLDWPRRRGWVRFKEWGNQFGDVVHISLLGRHVVILNSFAAAKDLMDKASCADRPEFTMAGELMGLSSSVILAPYGDDWKQMGRLTRSGMSKDAIERYKPHLAADVLQLVQCISEDPSEYRAALRLFIGKQIVRDTYGIEIVSMQDPYIKLAEEVLDKLNYAVIVGSYFVDVWPILKHLPSWIPGAGFQIQASKARSQVNKMVNLPFAHAKRRIEEGQDNVSMTSTFLSILQGDRQEKVTDNLEHIVRWTTGSLYGAGVEPPFSSLTVFFLAMALNPAVQRRAQEELDTVIGQNTPPLLDDREELPYIDALINEVLRWHPPIPLGVARRSMSPEAYRGLQIPESSIIFANLWGIGRDSQIYANPEEFRPQRFLGPSPELDPKTWVFGFGRRCCPGVHYATSILYACVSSILAAFDISVPEGDLFEPEFSPNTNSYVEPFPCKITARASRK